MPNPSESQCYFVQLQIDSYLDGDLASAQQHQFMSHVQQCEACASEFRFAQTVQDNLMDLEQLDCDEQAMEPIHRLGNGSREIGKSTASTAAISLASIARLFNAAPLLLRYSLPVAAVAVLAIVISTSMLTPDQDTPIVAEQASAVPVQQVAQLEQYDPAEIRQAVEDLNLAIEYLHQLGRRTDALISDRFLIRPLQNSLNASFERAASRSDDQTLSDPI